MIVEAPASRTPHKKLGTRARPEHSQALRRTFQMVFLLLNGWIGMQFYFFVRFYETAGQSVRASRPAGVEGWLPIASLMNLKALLLTGRLPRIHPAGTFLLLAFLASSWLFRKSFCGWLCPVGTVSEYLWRVGRKLLTRNFRLPRAMDIPLRGVKYLLLGLFVYAVASMSVPAIRLFLESPYGMVDDVKMLNFFRTLGWTGGAVIAVLVAGSLGVQNFWCRYFCPYGALMGLASLAVRCASGATRRCASIAASAKGLARRRCRWIAWSRSARPNASAACNAWRRVRPRARCFFPHPAAAECRRGAWRPAWPRSFSALTPTPALPATGIPICPTASIPNWSLTPTNSSTRRMAPGVARAAIRWYFMSSARMPRTLLRTVAAACLALAARGQSPASWTVARSSHFEVYSQEDEKTARSGLERLEELRAFVAQQTGMAPDGSDAVRVIAFRSPGEYAPYRLQFNADAYYIGSETRHYLVLPSLDARSFGTVAHEYAHFLFQLAGLHLPPWLREGMADVFSSVRFGPGSHIGGELPDRAQPAVPGCRSGSCSPGSSNPRWATAIAWSSSIPRAGHSPKCWRSRPGIAKDSGGWSPRSPQACQAIARSPRCTASPSSR
jgi:hypothetical protein